jgi:carbonic anhydrase
VAAKPIGLHVHTPSEHVIDGRQFPLEMHIVHMVDNATLPGCGNASCLAVVGLLFEYGEEANPFIETIFSNMPTVEKVREGRSLCPCQNVLTRSRIHELGDIFFVC